MTEGWLFDVVASGLLGEAARQGPGPAGSIRGCHSIFASAEMTGANAASFMAASSVYVFSKTWSVNTWTCSSTVYLGAKGFNENTLSKKYKSLSLSGILNPNFCVSLETFKTREEIKVLVQAHERR